MHDPGVLGGWDATPRTTRMSGPLERTHGISGCPCGTRPSTGLAVGEPMAPEATQVNRPAIVSSICFPFPMTTSFRVSIHFRDHCRFSYLAHVHSPDFRLAERSAIGVTSSGHDSHLAGRSPKEGQAVRAALRSSLGSRGLLTRNKGQTGIVFRVMISTYP